VVVVSSSHADLDELFNSILAIIVVALKPPLRVFVSLSSSTEERAGVRSR
jgi:hypothetical protein